MNVHLQWREEHFMQVVVDDGKTSVEKDKASKRIITDIVPLVVD